MRRSARRPLRLPPPPKKAGLPDIRDSGGIRERFLSALPEPLRTDYRAALAEAVFARTFRALETLPPTRSALGGAPLLPAACPWPARDGKPLGFQTAPVFDVGEELEEHFYSHFRSLPPDARAELSELHDALLESEPCGHRVLSPPGLVQGAMDDELATAARAYNLPPDTRWTMLLQLESDRNLGWCWGDAGCLYFWLPTDDLAAARFDRCWVVLQCS